MGDWTFKNTYFLGLMTLGYIIGEIAHFLINTSSRATAREIHYGDQSCYRVLSVNVSSSAAKCTEFKSESDCVLQPHCEWNYSGFGLDYQVLAGPMFIVVFTVTSLIVGFTSDNLKSLGRHRIMAAGVLCFTLSCFLMGLSNAYWQLVILRMGIAAGEAVCRPVSGSLIAELFSESSRGLANGIFSWGVYYGYGLAFVIGISVTEADILGYSWRSSYVLSALPGFIVAALLLLTVRDPYDAHQADMDKAQRDHDGSSKCSRFKSYAMKVLRSFKNPALAILLLAACVRHTAGYCWAYNTRLYFQTYYPEFDLGLWIFGCSVGGGSFGVFFGGYFSDRIVVRLGLHSRLWVLAFCTLVATPFAMGTLYFAPPYAFICLMCYYFAAETWFAILFTVITEICNPEVKSTCIALFLFIMNNIGGNLPVIVDPIAKAIGYQEAIYVVWPGCVAASGILFFLASIPLWRQSRR